jgi:POT family proton-dependent oligopeptide transporter
VQRDRLWVAVVQGVFTTLHAAAFYQKGGLLNLYTRDRVDRTLLGVNIPTTWFLSVSIVIFMLATPLFAAAYLRLARRDRNPSASYKLAVGLIVLGAAYTVVGHAEAARVASDAASISAAWLIGMYVLFGISDSLVGPNQMALATKLAPGSYATFTIGVWNLTVGFGIWMAGLIGTVAERVGTLRMFSWLAVACVLAGALVLLLTPTMRRMMHGAEQRTPLRPASSNL